MRFLTKLRSWLLLGLALGIALFLITGEASGARVQNKNAVIDVYLPLTVSNYPWIASFGAQVSDFSDPGETNLVTEAGLQWARMDAFHWAKIEPLNTNAVGYQWSAVDEASLITASENGIQVIGIIRDTPDWARKNPPYACGAVSEGAIPEFANFVRELVKRYSVQPYNVKYWEIWNEPDVDPSLVSANSVFGCWGNNQDSYYGGGYYSQMLNQVYPVIKSVDSTAQIGIGGLLLDCDPTKDRKCVSGKFFEGIVRSGLPNFGGNFDFVSFHGYTPYAGGLSLDEHNPKWEHRGGVVLGKLDYIRHVLGKYDLDKPIFHTEGALTCPETNPTDCNPPGSEFEEAQADYVVWLYVRNWANDVDVTIWYQFQGPGWRYGGLLDGTQSPKPAYNALKFLAQELNFASYAGRVLENTAVAGYGFLRSDKKVWVLWSPDEVNTPVSLPSSAQKAYDKYGVEVPIISNQITVNSPLYIEFPR